MKKWLISVCVLAVGFVLSAQAPIRIFSDELSSGKYGGNSIEVSYSAPAAYKVTVFVNGKRQPEINQKGASKGTRKLTISGLPKVEYQKSTVKLVFSDSNGRAVDTKEYVMQYQDSRKDLYMLSIGVGGKLQDSSFPPLTFPKYDATNIRDCFRDCTKSYYKEKEFHLRCDPEETTLSSLRKKFASMADEVGEGSVFMLYLSGHGEVDKGEYYFITSDARKSKLAATALSGSEIRQYLHQMASKGAQVFVFLDSCHAEALYLRDENPSDGIVYYASCKADEMSAESLTWQNSVYANALIAAMTGTDGSAQTREGVITVSSLHDYLYSKVRRETGFVQNPLCYHPGLGDGHVVFIPKVRQQPVGNPDPLPVTPSLSGASAYQEALRYQSGNGVAKDLVQAFQLMKSAAESGYAKAFCPLAKMYHGGRGVTKDRDKAVFWYQKAADAGDLEAKRTLMNM